MRNYVYVVMENDQEFSYGEYMGGGIRPVSVFSSQEEADAVVLLRRKSAERRYANSDDAPSYYVERVLSYS